MTLFQPLADKILVKAIEDTAVTAGGIVIPDIAKEKPQKGTVVSVGTGVYEPALPHVRPLLVQKGDAIIFARYAGIPITLDGEDYLVLREAEIIGVLSDE